MTQPISRPLVPEQPSAAFYGPLELALFKAYNRDTYRAVFGVDAPAFDPSKPVKAWFDSTVDLSDPGNVAIYRVLGHDASGAWALKQMVLPVTEAAVVNLPGTIQYATYSVASTSASRGGSPLNPNYLSTEADARAMMQEIGGESLVDEGSLLMFPALYPPEEPRRWWSIVWRGRTVNAGLLMLSRNAKGIGAPGHWDLSGQEPQWIADPVPTSTNDTRPPRDMPLRSLLANEKLQSGPMGLPQILRTDLQSAQQQASGQFTPEDRAMLAKILQLLSARS